MVIHAERRARAERLRSYFDLQLRFAQTVAEVSSFPLADAVAQYTNFHRRFGFGVLQDSPTSPEWTRYVDRLLHLPTHDDRVAWTQACFLQAPGENAPANEQRFGCFSCSPPDAEGVLRIHFVNRDHDGIGPLNRNKMSRRKSELREMFAFIKSAYPAATGVRGTSWLYQTEAYRRLFPTAYGDSREIRTAAQRFDGSSSWGQFLDHREQVKPDLQEAFLQNLTTLDMEALWRVFPLPAMVTNAPVGVFYDYYDVSLTS